MSAIKQLLTDHLDIWTAADTEKKSGRGRSSGNAATVYGIKKLRELILELAVRGKLVPQDPNDEPASELLKKIQAEKAKLIAEGKIKKEKPQPPIGDEEKPFNSPLGWTFVRLGELLSKIGAGSTPLGGKQVYVREGIPFLRSQNVWNDGLRLDDVAFITSETHVKMSGTHVYPGDLLFNITGASIGRCAIVPESFEFGNVSQHVTIVRPVSKVILDFLHRVLISNHVQQTVMDVQVGVSREGLSIGKLAQFVIPVPPLKEQHRIVAKVDELMALCDQLETQHNNAAEAHEKLVSQLLATLTQPQSAEEFSENWQRIAEHFDTLFTTESSIDALKQTLLQLAVMSKLVSQDPSDEPASELLKKIQAEKAKLIAEGKIKKEKPLPLIRDEEKPFTLPDRWEWVRLGTVLLKITDGTHHSPPNLSKGDFKYISAKNIKSWGIDLSDITYVTKDIHDEIYGRCDPVCGDLLYIKDGATTGIATINTLNEPFSMLSSVALLKPSIGTENRFLLKAMTAPFFYAEMRSEMTGVAITRVTLAKLNNACIPLPPLSEQVRIVAKVDELMALCDQLKSRITAANQLQQKLADVMVEQALTSELQVADVEAPNRSEARALLGAEIIHQLYTEKTFGQVKLQKIVHLCEYVAEIESVAGEYQRYAAGPHDPEMIAEIESAIQQNAWYEEYPREKVGHAYRPLQRAGDHRKQFGEYWQAKLPIIQKLIDIMRKWDTERCEIFSTLYAAWNDLLIFGKPVSDEAILSEVLERWNDSKTKISKKSWLEGMEWMRKNGFIPRGTGRATRRAGLFD